MKKYIIFPFVLLYIFPIYSQLPVRTLKTGIHAVYGDNVLYRNAPNQHGSIKHIVPIGTKINVIQKASKAEKVDSIDDYWYQVIYDLDTGYIWGALISDIFLEGDLNGDSIQEIFMAYCNTFLGGYDFEYREKHHRFEFRVAQNNKKISELKFKTYNQYICDSAYMKTFNQFSPPFTAICLTDSFIGGFYGVGEFYFRLNKNNLDSLFKIDIHAGEGGVVHYQKLIMPSDSGGMENTLIKETKWTASDLNTDHEGPMDNWKFYQEIYNWDGKKFTFVKKQ